MLQAQGRLDRLGFRQTYHYLVGRFWKKANRFFNTRNWDMWKSRISVRISVLKPLCMHLHWDIRYSHNSYVLL